MSTTFGVEIKVIVQGETISQLKEVAFRSNGIRFTNALAHLLPNDLEVIPMDNGPQGIFTIGDIKREIGKGVDGDYWRTTEIK